MCSDTGLIVEPPQLMGDSPDSTFDETVVATKDGAESIMGRVNAEYGSVSETGPLSVTVIAMYILLRSDVK